MPNCSSGNRHLRGITGTPTRGFCYTQVLVDKVEKIPHNLHMKKPFKTIFLQDWGTYSYQTVVTVGLHREDILRWAKKNLSPKKFKAIQDNEELKEDLEFCEGYFIWVKGNAKISVLWLREWSTKWFWIDTLAHELNHAIHAWADYAVLTEEDEAKAYQFEYLFRKMREELERRRKL